MERVPGIRYAVAAFGVVLTLGTAGYMLLGFRFLDALYQTVTTVTTVGFREVQPLDPAGQVFTIVLILVGVGTALYALGRSWRDSSRATYARTREAAHGPRDQLDERARDRVRLGSGGSSCGSTCGAPADDRRVDRDPARLAGVDELHVPGTSPMTKSSRRPGSTAPTP